MRASATVAHSQSTTKRQTCLEETLEKADVVVNLVGILSGDFERVQLRGTEHLVDAVKTNSSKDTRFIQISAIGADVGSTVPYAKTKGLAEMKVLDTLSNACVIRPSLVFGKEDNFFNVCAFDMVGWALG